MSKKIEAKMWIDTHTHLDYDYPFDTATYIARAQAVGVTGFITIGANCVNWPHVQKLAEIHAEVFFTVGIHPHDAKNYNDEVAHNITAYAKHPRCVALGEMGLDYYYDNSPRDLQRTTCEKQLDLALTLQKPVVIHSRDAEDDLLPLLTQYARQCKLSQGPGVIHCFSGTEKFATACLNLGFYLSFSGIVTFKKADEIKKVARLTPLNRLLVETDSPYLAPLPYRGKPNESSYMIETCKCIAELKGLDLQTLSQATLQNTRTLFNLPDL